MAVSLSFGVLFATFITLVLVPAGYLIAADVKAVTRGLWHRSSAEPSVQKSAYGRPRTRPGLSV